MMELFFMGGALFMSLLTIVFIGMLAIAVMNGLKMLNGSLDVQAATRGIGFVKSAGLLAFVIGLLGQLIGLFSAFQAIEAKTVDISPELLASGFKVSMIPMLYGSIIFVLSLVIWFGLNALVSKNKQEV